MSTTPLVSIIIPTHNAPDYLAQAVDSITRQTYNNWELVVIDDGSTPPTDLTPQITAFPDKIFLYRNKIATGGSSAKNLGIEKSKGDIVAYLDHDDLYTAIYLERAVYALTKYPQIDLFFMGIDWFGERCKGGKEAYTKAMEKLLGTIETRQLEPGLLGFGDDLFNALLRSVPLAFQRPVVRRKALEKVGPYHSNCITWDGDWALRAIAKSLRAGLIYEPLYRQRAEGQGFASKPENIVLRMKTSIEIKERILRDSSTRTNPYATETNIKKAIARNFFDLAYHQYTNGNFNDSFSAWTHSQKYNISFSRIKFLAPLLFAALKNSISSPNRQTP